MQKREPTMPRLVLEVLRKP